MAKQNRFLIYKNITLYKDLQSGKTSTYRYTIFHKKQVEYQDYAFDIRNIPRKYRYGLEIELDLDPAKAPESAVYLYEAEIARKLIELNEDIHKEVLRRAIDDSYDFRSAGRGNYSQFLRRFVRWINMKYTSRHRK